MFSRLDKFDGPIFGGRGVRGRGRIYGRVRYFTVFCFLSAMKQYTLESRIIGGVGIIGGGGQGGRHCNNY